MKQYKNRFFSLIAACCTAACCVSFSAQAAQTPVTMHENYAAWRQSAIYDEGMLEYYLKPLTHNTNDYMLSTALPLSGQDNWYDSGKLNGSTAVSVLVPNNYDSAVFYISSLSDSDAANAILQNYFPEHASSGYSQNQLCFRLPCDMDQGDPVKKKATLDAIRRDLTDTGLISAFYYCAPAYRQLKYKIPYLTGYSARRPDSPEPLQAKQLQDYVSENALHCTVVSDDSSSFFYVVPDEKISFQEHWALALRLYRDLGVIPEMYDDISQQVFPTGSGIPGDVNADTALNPADAQMLGHTLATGETAADPLAGDLNMDGRLNAVDLTMLKRALLPAEQPEVTVQGEPPVLALDPSLPSVGTNRIPVFAVSFPDCAFTEDDIAQLLQKNLFSAADPLDPAYPLESVSAYFDRASFGRMRLTGDVFAYTAEKPINSYADDYAQGLADEIMAAFDGQTDFTEYDADNDQTMDAMMLVLPDAALKIDRDGDKVPDWWPFSVPSVSPDEYDGIRTGTYCAVTFDSDTPDSFVGKAAHELCHAMGLPDYYKYNDTLEKEGMTGPAGKELMDEGSGDLSACSRLLLGWLTEDEVQVYTGETHSFLLTPMQNQPSCIMIPREADAGCLSEYFLIEYVTPEANNALFDAGGIRILHVQAEVTDSSSGKVFAYSNHSSLYDQSNQKQRVLRLVNDYGLFYPSSNNIQTSLTIDGGTEGFRWYDADGALTADTGLRINISSKRSGPFYHPNLFDSVSSLCDPRHLTNQISGIYEIVISEVTT